MQPPEPHAMNTIFDTFLGSLPLLIAVIALLVRTESRITKLETIIERCAFCTPTGHNPKKGDT